MEQDFGSLDEFILELKKLDIKKIAFSEVNERRAEQTKEDLLEVVVVREVTLKAYKDAVIYRYYEKTDTLDDLYERLINEGFEVKRINRNIT